MYYCWGWEKWRDEYLNSDGQLVAGMKFLAADCTFN